VLGGTGLQETQIRSMKEALAPHNIKVFAAHDGEEHDEVMRQMLDAGYKYMITQVASDGLNKDWLGHELNKDNIDAFFERAEKFGFHPGGEGGYFDTFVVDGPIFKDALEVEKSHTVMEAENAGHLVVDELKLVKKTTIQ
jgi:uncharacterized protein (TIGR00290 family)